MKDLTALLAAQPFLKGMSREHLELLAADSLSAEFPADERILHEDAPANRFYLIQEGQVVIEAQVRDGEPRHIQTVGAGDLLGWSWLFPPYCWHFDARAATHVKAICFYGKHVRELCEANHDLGYELMKRVSETLIQRLQHTRGELLEHKALAQRG
jgi:CRP/FNR family cyclic AMP-dependent transcriptional regulator